MNPAMQADLGKLVLRLALGVLVLLHGVAKLRGGVDPIEGMLTAQGLPGVLAYGALLGEVLGPLMLIAINMLFALGLAHMGQLGQLNDQGGWALELQGMFLFSAIALALLGPGRYSVNNK